MKGLSWQAVDRRSQAERKTKITLFPPLGRNRSDSRQGGLFPIFSVNDK
jgi:hypothetical protein